MPVLMTNSTFKRLADIRGQLVDGRFTVARPPKPGVAGIFVP